MSRSWREDKNVVAAVKRPSRLLLKAFWPRDGWSYWCDTGEKRIKTMCSTWVEWTFSLVVVVSYLHSACVCRKRNHRWKKWERNIMVPFIVIIIFIWSILALLTGSFLIACMLLAIVCSMLAHFIHLQSFLLERLCSTVRWYSSSMTLTIFDATRLIFWSFLDSRLRVAISRSKPVMKCCCITSRSRIVSSPKQTPRRCCMLTRLRFICAISFRFRSRTTLEIWSFFWQATCCCWKPCLVFCNLSRQYAGLVGKWWIFMLFWSRKKKMQGTVPNVKDTSSTCMLHVTEMFIWKNDGERASEWRDVQMSRDFRAQETPISCPELSNFHSQFTCTPDLPIKDKATNERGEKGQRMTRQRGCFCLCAVVTRPTGSPFIPKRAAVSQSRNFEIYLSVLFEAQNPDAVVSMTNIKHIHTALHLAAVTVDGGLCRRLSSPLGETQSACIMSLVWAYPIILYNGSKRWLRWWSLHIFIVR